MAEEDSSSEFHLDRAAGALSEAGKASAAAFTLYLTLIASATVVVFVDTTNADLQLVETPLGKVNRWVAAEIFILLALMAAHKSIALGISARLLVFKIKTYLRAEGQPESTWDLKHPTMFFAQNIVLRWISHVPEVAGTWRAWGTGVRHGLTALYFYLFLVHPALLLARIYMLPTGLIWWFTVVAAAMIIAISMIMMAVVPGGKDPALTQLVRVIEKNENKK